MVCSMMLLPTQEIIQSEIHHVTISSVGTNATVQRMQNAAPRAAWTKPLAKTNHFAINVTAMDVSVEIILTQKHCNSPGTNDHF